MVGYDEEFDREFWLILILRPVARRLAVRFAASCERQAGNPQKATGNLVTRMRAIASRLARACSGGGQRMAMRSKRSLLGMRLKPIAGLVRSRSLLGAGPRIRCPLVLSVLPALILKCCNSGACDDVDLVLGCAMPSRTARAKGSLRRSPNRQGTQKRGR